MRAIELNGVAVDANKAAFDWGRVLHEKPELLTQKTAVNPEMDLKSMQDRHRDFLTQYQDEKWADRYDDYLHNLSQRQVSDEFLKAVSKSLFKLMTYKDEYEVARLHSDASFQAEIAAEFEGEYKVIHHLAPPFLVSDLDERGRPKKKCFGPWIRKVFPMLAKLKFLRGTAFDPFGYHNERKLERELIDWYKALISEVADGYTPATAQTALKIASAPLQIKGYGAVKLANISKVKAQIRALQKESNV
nr:DUF6537 domain-containing protein [Sneathiella glossodoripedis]